MNLRPTRTFTYFLFFVCLSFLLNLSCSKDGEVLLDAVLTDDTVPTIQEEDATEVDQDSEGGNTTPDIEELESRTTVFPTIQDAYIQNGQGFDQNIVRLQENYRRSYLMFDMSQIDSIGGVITSARLEFIINSDDGNGTIRVFRGATSDWTENSLTEKSAPETHSEIGKIEQVYNVDAEVSIDLNTTELLPELSTLILEHEDGNDLAFASKENKAKKGPKLIVTYDAPISADAIIVNDNQVIDESEEEATEEDTTEEDTTEEDTTEEDTTEEDTTEEDTTKEDTTEEDTTEEETNSAPVSVPEGTPSSGTAPLEVAFRGNNSTDDKAVTGYTWNFKDGSSANSANPSHTFTTPGTYSVELTVRDAEGLTDKETITITVNEPPNEAPAAVASANVTSGTAPLQVNFTGSNSTDDKAIDRYLWNFKDGSTSNAANPSHTFNTPGTYYVDLFVYDAEGLSDFAGVTITVEEEVVTDPSCNTISTSRGTEGFKQWCWADLASDVASTNALDAFPDGVLYRSAHYKNSGTYVQNGRLHFNLIANSSTRDYRQEIRPDAYTPLPVNTEEWLGFNLAFDGGYVPDLIPWVMTQFKIESLGGNVVPMISLQPLPANHGGLGNAKGEIGVVNAAVNQPNLSIAATGVVPVAGGNYDIVMHIVWGNASSGRFRLWINGALVYDKHERILFASEEKVGYWKLGVYQANWRNVTRINNSIANGTTELHTSIGNLKQIMRKPSHADYGSNAYNQVRPND